MSAILLKTTLERDARLVSEEGRPFEAGFVLVRRWEHINPQDVDELVDVLQLVKTVTTPLADQQDYAGTFAVSSVRADATELDSVHITQTLTLIITPTSQAQLPTAICSREKEVLQPFSIQEGIDNLFVCTYRNLNPNDTTRDLMMTISISIPASGFSEKDRKFTIDDNRIGILTVLWRKVDWFNTNAATSVTLRETNAAALFGDGARTLKEHDGVPIDQAAAAVQTLKAAPASGFVSGSVNYTDDGDGKARIRHEQNKFNSTATSNTSVGSFAQELTFSIAGSRKINIQVKPKISDALALTIMNAAVGWGVPSGFVLLRLVRRKHDDGTSDVIQIAATPGNDGGRWDDDDNASRFSMIKCGLEPQYRQRPAFEDQQQIRWHYICIERLYTNVLSRAIAWSKDDNTIISGGLTGDGEIAWGYFAERERGPTRYVSYRSELDFWTIWVNAKTDTSNKPETNESTDFRGFLDF